jgi:hypothetical protein
MPKPIEMHAHHPPALLRGHAGLASSGELTLHGSVGHTGRTFRWFRSRVTKSETRLSNDKDSEAVKRVSMCRWDTLCVGLIAYNGSGLSIRRVQKGWGVCHRCFAS